MRCIVYKMINTAAINGIVYTPAQQAQLFEDYINQDKYLKKHRGQYAERNGAQVPWRNQVDFKLIQDVFTNIGKNNIAIRFIKNPFHQTIGCDELILCSFAVNNNFILFGVRLPKYWHYV